MRKKNGYATYSELALLASSVGLVEKSEQGRQAQYAWLAADEKGARAALFSRVAASRVAASAPVQARQVGYLRRKQGSAAGIQTYRPINAAEAQAMRTGDRLTHPFKVPRSVGAAGLRLLGRRRRTSSTAACPSRTT